MQWYVLIVAIALAPLNSIAQDLADFTVIDLSHTYNQKTIYWPTSPSAFELEQLAHGHTEGGYFYAANALSTPEHGGTHLDAPIHFFAGRRTVEEIPINQLIGHAFVIDVSEQSANDPDYLLTAQDVLAFEAEHEPISEGSLVLMRTDWSKRWPDVKAYLGDDTPGDASNLHFPGFGADAARLLVLERKVAALGLDTASIDFGQSKDFMTHRVAAEHNVVGLENLTNLDKLPAVGAQIIALPMKIEGGSGAPTRVIALLPRSDKE